MERKEMKVIDVMRENMKILSELRIPIKEPQIWSAVNGVSLNTQMCIEAMERAEAEVGAKSAQESADDENVVKTNAEERK